jgi:two-component system osmolarity sensor histidine kinase EnvZ
MAIAPALPRRLRAWRRYRRRLPRLAGWLPRTLFGRSLLLIVVPLLILQIVLVVIFYDRHWETVSRWLAIGVAGEVAWLADQLEAAPDDAARAAVLQDARRYFGFAVSLEPGGQLEAASERSGFLPPSLVDQAMQGAFDSRVDYPFRIDTRPAQVDRVAVYVQLDDGLLRVLPDRKRVDTSTTVLLVAWMIGASLLLIAIAIYFLSRQLRPIRRLARAADSFGKGRDLGDVRLEGAVEIRQASLAYNRMRQRILRHLSQRTNLLAAVSHDLSTPLTRMSLELEMMRGELADAGAVEALEEDIHEMRRLVDAYLDFARGEAAEPMRSVPAGKLMARLRARAERNRQPVTFDVEAGADERLTVRATAVERMLANLVDNAVKHAGRVAVRLALGRDHAEIFVDDDGPGIPEAERERVFAPFYRGDGARRAEGGVGMGLTIARDVAVAHGGGIELETSPLGGLRCRVTLPR